jgi:hypothetical protein
VRLCGGDAQTTTSTNSAYLPIARAALGFITPLEHQSTRGTDQTRAFHTSHHALPKSPVVPSSLPPSALSKRTRGSIKFSIDIRTRVLTAVRSKKPPFPRPLHFTPWPALFSPSRYVTLEISSPHLLGSCTAHFQILFSHDDISHDANERFSCRLAEDA